LILSGFSARAVAAARNQASPSLPYSTAFGLIPVSPHRLGFSPLVIISCGLFH